MNTTEYEDPSANTLKVVVDQLNKAMGEFIVNPSEERMHAAKIARLVVHGGIDKIVQQRDRLAAEVDRLKTVYLHGQPADTAREGR